MARFSTSDREHRRGLVLGLTLAEVLLLLLFVVLLALASRVFQLKENAERIDSQLAELKEILGESDVAGVKKIAEQISRTSKLEKSIDLLKNENAKLKTELKIVEKLGAKGEKALLDAASAIERAARFRPDDPPAALSRAVELLETVPAEIKPEDLKALTQLGNVNEKIKKLEGAVATVESDRDRFRRERDNLMRSKGGGLQYPSCWTNDKGETEYMFDITFLDGGLVVKNHSEEARKADEAWSLVSDFKRNSEISESVFVAATARLFQWSKERECRFVVILRDQTGENKSRYKRLMSSVERHFYKNELSSKRTATPVSTPSRPAVPEPQSPAVPELQSRAVPDNVYRPDSTH